MAKKKKNTGKENPEPVTNRDQSEEVVANSSQSEAAKPSGDHLDEVVANCDNLNKDKKGDIVLSQHDIEKLIITVRGEQVLIDQDIARLYGVTTTRLNEQAKRSPKLLPEQIFATGCVWDAWEYVSNLVRSAEKRIILIDNFVDDRVLSMLSKRADGVSATIHTRYNESFQTDLMKHNEQYPAIEFIQLPHKNHDRFLIIDDKVYSLGASLKDMGAGLCAVMEMKAKPKDILSLLK